MLNKRGGNLLVFICLAIGSFFFRYFSLAQTDFANGWDGYFYLVQLKALQEEGAMHSPDGSPVYWLLYGIAWIVGDPVAALKLLSAGLAGLFTGLVYLLARRLSGMFGLALLAGLLSLFSPSLTFFCSQFPKNLLGLCALMAFAYTLLRPGPLQRILTFVLAFISHRMTAGLALLLLAFRSISLRNLGLIALLVLLGLGTALLLPGLIHVSDLARFEGTFQARPSLQAWEFLQLMGLERLNINWVGEIIFSQILLGAVLVVFIFRRPSRDALAIFLLLLLLLFPFFAMTTRGMGYRFFLSFMVLFPLLLALLPGHFPVIPGIVMGLFLLVASFFSWRSYAPDVLDPDYAHYESIIRQTELILEDKAPELLIGHKGLAEMMTFRTGVDVLPWQPEYEVDSTKLWRIAHGIFPMEFRYYLGGKDAKQVHELSLEYHLLPENVWQRFVLNSENDRDEDLVERIFSWQNPHEIRPAFLLRGK